MITVDVARFIVNCSGGFGSSPCFVFSASQCSQTMWSTSSTDSLLTLNPSIASAESFSEDYCTGSPCDDAGGSPTGTGFDSQGNVSCCSVLTTTSGGKSN